MARTVWPGETALGKCIRIGFDPNFDPETATGPPTPSATVACREVVGVAGDVRQRSLVPTGNEEHLMQYFVPFTQVPVPPFIPNPERGAWEFPSPPVRLSESRVEVERAPLLGEHTVEVLREELALDEDALRNLVAAGIVGVRQPQAVRA